MGGITIPVEEFAPHEYQVEVLGDFDAGAYKYALLNWHRRARKTTLGINLLIREACKNKNKVYGYVAPTYRQAKSIIWTDPNMLSRYLPEEVVAKRSETDLLIKFKTGSLLVIRGADNPDSIRGTDYEGLFIDEFAQVKPEIWEEILRPIIAQDPNRWAIFAFTPKGVNHAFEYWNKAEYWENWSRYLLKASDSRIMPEEELEQAKSEMPDVLYRQEFECEFSAGDEYTLIVPDDIDQLKGIVKIERNPRIYMSLDPAAGGDEAVLMTFEGTEVRDIKTYNIKDTMKLVGKVMIEYRRSKADQIGIDSCGMGKPVADRIKELGANVVYVNSAEKAIEADRYQNVRAEMWDVAAGMIRGAEVSYIKDYELRRQLTAVNYIPEQLNSNGKIKLEPKQKVKERIGRSPDWADAYVIGVYMYKKYGKGMFGSPQIQRHRRQVTDYDPYGVKRKNLIRRRLTGSRI